MATEDAKGNLHDERGRFTSKGRGSTPYIDFLKDRGYATTEMSEELAKHTVEAILKGKIVPMDFFGNKTKERTRDYHSNKNRTPPKEVFGFAGYRDSTKHHVRHQEEMGYKTSSEYVNGARDFWVNETGTVYYSAARDSFYKYNEKSEKLLVASSDGTIHTFMLYSRKQFWRIERWDSLEKI